MKGHLNKDQSKDLLQNRTSGLLQIDIYIKAAQHKLAKYLQVKAERLSNTKKKVSLLLFCLLFSGCSIAVMLYSFLNLNTTVSTSRITLPTYVVIHQPQPKIRDSLINHDEYTRINQFRNYLEHLQEDATGRKVYDSLLQARPYLMDSIHIIDSIFLTQ